jgi:hypothetical protein
MYITDDCHRRRDVYNVALPHQHLFRLFTYLSQQGFAEELFLEGLFYTLVQVEGGHLVVLSCNVIE